MIFANLNAAIIDLDGTMVDTLADFVVAINLMLNDLELAAVESDVVAMRVGKGSENLVNSVLNHAVAQSLQEQAAIEKVAYRQRALQLYLRHYHAINGQYAQVYPGVIQGLTDLQQAGLKLACLTNKPLAFAQALLRLKGLDGFFGHVFGGDSFEAKKPHPLPVLKTCGAMGSVPARTLMVGDSSNDALAARAAGCPVVLVTYGYNHGQPVASAGADVTIDSLIELKSLLNKAIRK